MALPISVTKQFTDTITLEAHVSDDVYGKPTYADADTLDAFVVYRTRHTVNDSGDVVVQRGFILVDGETTIDIRDRITLDTGEIVIAQEIQPFNRQGLSFQKVIF